MVLGGELVKRSISSSTHLKGSAASGKKWNEMKKFSQENEAGTTT